MLDSKTKYGLEVGPAGLNFMNFRASGDENAIRTRIQQYFEAGADHICIQPLRRGTLYLSVEDEKVLELLAPMLTPAEREPSWN